MVGREGEDQRPIAGEAFGNPQAAWRKSGTLLVSCQLVTLGFGACR
jgi:hypothetical protein